MDEMTPQERKSRPITRGVLDYFPDALLEVAHVSYVGNEQHNPGEPLHWNKSKSTDEADCIVRHLLERGKVDSDGLRHSAKVAWRALALLQREIENERTQQVVGGSSNYHSGGNAPISLGGGTPGLLDGGAYSPPQPSGFGSVGMAGQNRAGEQDSRRYHSVETHDGTHRRADGSGPHVAQPRSSNQSGVGCGTSGESTSPRYWWPSPANITD